MASKNYKINIAGKTYDVEVGDISKSPVEVSVNGTVYQVEIPESAGDRASGVQATFAPKPVVAAAAATTYTLTAAAVDVAEGDSGQSNMVFNLELDKAAEGDVVVNYESLTTGTGTAGSDFDSASGAVTFVAGQTNASVSVKVNGDTTVESDETVKVTFSGGSLVASVTASGSITSR